MALVPSLVLLAAASHLTFDHDDASILWPMPFQAAQVAALLPLSFAADAGMLLPEADFQSLLATVLPPTDPDRQNPHVGQAATYAAWRIVSLRADPCEKDDPGDTTEPCHVQVRLVAQPVRTDGGAPSADDAAIHLVFDEGGADVKLVGALNALKATSPVATSGMTLQVHPALSGDGVAGPWAAELGGFVKAFAGRHRLMAATIALNVDGATWRFGRMGVSPSGHLVQTALPMVPESGPPLPKTQQLRLRTGASPQGTGSDRIDTGGTDAEVRQLLFNIENPSLNSFGTTDCASCHQASVRLGPANFGLPGFGAYAVPPGVTATFPTGLAEFDDFDVRAFGYESNNRPAITLGSFNLSARIAADINANAAYAAPSAACQAGERTFTLAPQADGTLEARFPDGSTGPVTADLTDGALETCYHP